VTTVVGGHLAQLNQRLSRHNRNYKQYLLHTQNYRKSNTQRELQKIQNYWKFTNRYLSNTDKLQKISPRHRALSFFLPSKSYQCYFIRKKTCAYPLDLQLHLLVQHLSEWLQLHPGRSPSFSDLSLSAPIRTCFSLDTPGHLNVTP